MSLDQSSPARARRRGLLLGRISAAGAAMLVMGMVAALDAGLAGADPAAASPVGVTPGSVGFSYQGSPQSFIVPAGVTSLQITGSGGSGGNGTIVAGVDESVAVGGLGAEITASFPVTPGDQLAIDVGSVGGPGVGYVGGGGGTSSAGQGGGPGGNTNVSATDGAPGGGGGGGTTVVDLTTGQVLLDAGGGGGSGGSGVGAYLSALGSNGGPGANAGDPAANRGGGNGIAGAGAGNGSGGLFASAGQPVGTSGSGEAPGSGAGTGGGGGGGVVGGGGGSAGTFGGGGGGGGGAGSSAWAPGATNVLVSNAPRGDGGVLVSWPSLAQLVGPSQSFALSGSPQSFTVPAGVTSLHITGSGGSGGAGSIYIDEQESPAPGGLGAQISETVAVTPGDLIAVDVGGQGGGGSCSSGGTPGSSSGSGENGGPGGNQNSFLDGCTGGGGGGGTLVEDASTAQILLDAGGGGGGGGGGAGPNSFNSAYGSNGGIGGNAGSPAAGNGGGNGSNGAGAGYGAYGSFAANGVQVAGTSGNGEQIDTGAGTGGGGGGGVIGGTGGGAGTFGGGGGGGGGAGSSEWAAGATNVLVSNAPRGDGGVLISWAIPPVTPVISLSASPNPSVSGAAVTLTATVTPPAGFSGALPSGDVTFVDYTAGGVAIGLPAALGTTSPATASITTSSLAVGTDQIYAYYSGDGSFTTVTSSLLGEVVVTPPPWTSSSSGPTARSAPAMAYDPSLGETLLFGGGGPGRVFHNDTWIHYSAGNTWSPVKAGPSPSARTGAGLVYDATIARFVLFGGVSSTGFLGDTWTFDPTVNRWTELSTTGAPRPRSGAAMVAAPDGSVVLFGGLSTTGFLGDTWLFDPTTSTWTAQHPIASPSARYSPGAALDATTGNVVLFGGAGAHGLDGDTWSYAVSSDTWSQLATAGTPPPPSVGSGLAFDSQSGGLVLVDGATATGPSGASYTFDPTSATWATLSTSASPPAREAPGFVYDSRANLLEQFGGWNGSSFLSDTWELPG